MDTKTLERNINTIIMTGSGYGSKFLPVLRKTKNILKRINQGLPTAENYFQLGELCMELEDHQLAFDAFSTGYNINHNHVNCGLYCALLLEQHEKWHDALKIYKELNLLDPNNIHIVERMLLIFYQQHNIKEVLKTCYYFLEKELHYPNIYKYIAKVYYDCGNVKKSIQHLNNALMIDPEDEECKNTLILHLYKNKDFELVVEYRDYLENTESVPVQHKLLYANSLVEIGEDKYARNYFVKLLKNEDKFTVLSEIALYHMNYEGNLKKGISINQYILKREPANIFALTNLALISDSDFSTSAYQKILKQHPDEPLFRMNYGHRLLQLGELKEGFELYESRVDRSLPHLAGRLSYPDTIIDKTIFIWNEQGIGDQYIWSWIFNYLQDDNIKIKIQVDKRLKPLMERSFPQLSFTGKESLALFENEKFDNYDAEMVQVSLGKYYIPQIRQAQKMFDQGKVNKPHIKVDKEKANLWNKRLQKKTLNKTVGICWRSGITGNMRDLGYLSAENIVETFKDLNCSVVNLQYDFEDEEIELIISSLGERFINFSEIDLKNDQDNLAALISELDLVFSVNTAVMTLAGSIGVPILCPGIIGTLGKPYNVMLPTVRSIAGPKPIRKNTERYITEIKTELKILSH